MPAALDLVGQRFGRLLVLERAGTKWGSTAWLCLCDCGARKVIGVGPLRCGGATSCGCFHKEQLAARSTSHGATRGGKFSPEYTCWASAIGRCCNASNPEYENYGGRGISFHPSWRDSFDLFLADVGPRPSLRHSLDRFPNMNGNYEPGNVRWATQREQCNNTRWNVFITFRGERLTVSDWARRLGVNYGTLRSRVKRLGGPEAIASFPGGSAV